MPWVVLTFFLASATPPGLEIDCARPSQARALIGRAQLSEVEYLEDVSREALWEAFGRCPGGPGGGACRAAAEERSQARLRQQRAAVEAKYRKILEDFELRCRAAIT